MTLEEVVIALYIRRRERNKATLSIPRINVSDTCSPIESSCLKLSAAWTDPISDQKHSRLATLVKEP